MEKNKNLIKDLDQEIKKLRKLKENLNRILRNSGRSNFIYKKELEDLFNND